MVTRFDTPGGLRDLPAGSSFYDEWHATVNRLFRDGSTGPVPGSGFYNPSRRNVTVAAGRPVVWMGFPRDLFGPGQSDGRIESFRQGDVRGREGEVTLGEFTQVEYLEWFTHRDGDGRVTKVTFTTEVPEYWIVLHAHRPDGPARVLQLYRELLGNPAITAADLTDDAGDYDPLNRWNTRDGIVHFIVSGPANTLGAAIGLASEAVAGPLVADNYELTGLARTSADPRVVIDAKGLARRGLQVTFAEPIGVYIGGWDDTGFTKPDGSPAGDYWRVVRPTGASGPPALRLEYEVPKHEGFVVGDVSIGGRPIEFGGQLAEHVTALVNGSAGTLA